MVIDDYGHIAGLVTIEDVLEEIVGEIEDEYDTEEEDDIRPRGKGTFSVRASTLIDHFNAHFGMTLPNDEFDTIGGLVMKAFGRLPRRGESIELGRCWFRVLTADNRVFIYWNVVRGKKKIHQCLLSKLIFPVYLSVHLIHLQQSETGCQCDKQHKEISKQIKLCR